MLYDEVSEDEHSFDEIDDSNNDPDFVLPQEDNYHSSGEEANIEDDERLEQETMEVIADIPEAPALPEYVFGRLRKNKAGPPYWWSTTSGPSNVWTPAQNIIRGKLPGLKGPA